jgi:hypothetical protein
MIRKRAWASSLFGMVHSSICLWSKRTSLHIRNKTLSRQHPPEPGISFSTNRVQPNGFPISWKPFVNGYFHELCGVGRGKKTLPPAPLVYKKTF